MPRYLVRPKFWRSSPAHPIYFVEAFNLYQLFWAVDELGNPYQYEYAKLTRPKKGVSYVSNTGFTMLAAESADWKDFTRDDGLNPRLKARKEEQAKAQKASLIENAKDHTLLDSAQLGTVLIEVAKSNKAKPERAYCVMVNTGKGEFSYSYFASEDTAKAEFERRVNAIKQEIKI